VIGVIEPAGPAAQQIVVVGHHDSTYVYTYLARLRKLYVFRIGGAYLFSLFGFCISLLFGLYRIVNQSEPACRGVLLIILLAGLFFMVPVFFYMGRKGSPGAGDNLVACAMGIKIAERFGGVHAPKRLQRTRVIILSTDGEEPGLLGAEAFARKHRAELLKVKTRVLTFDSIYKARELTLLTKDRNGTIRLSGAMAEDCGAIAAELGYPVKMSPIPTFAGATDAARFAEIGVEALSIIGMAIPPIRENPGFHTPNDTVERIEPEAVEACLDIACRYIQEKDRST
jgi:Zn-dependent M28 family amino/carboxypeptidase